MQLFVALYVYPFYNFLQCWTGTCAPLHWPFN